MKAAHRPHPVPPDLVSFPYHHAASEQALRTMADELLAFNADMNAAVTWKHGPTYILHGEADTIAEPHWHLPWLRQQVPYAKLTLLQGIGHTPHHRAYGVARSLLLETSSCRKTSLNSHGNTDCNVKEACHPRILGPKTIASSNDVPPWNGRTGIATNTPKAIYPDPEQCRR
jgi:hypothetical protein